MKLLLTLLAILTGFAGGDAVRAAPVTPSAFGAAVALAESASEARALQQVHRPQQAAAQRYIPDRASPPRAITTAPAQPGTPSYGLRTRQ